MRYIPATKSNIEEMLKEIGVDSIDELFFLFLDELFFASSKNLVKSTFL